VEHVGFTCNSSDFDDYEFGIKPLENSA